VKKLDTKIEYRGEERLEIGDIILKDGLTKIVVEGNILSEGRGFRIDFKMLDVRASSRKACAGCTGK